MGATHRQQWRPPLMDEDGEEDDGAAQPEHPLWGPSWINKDHLTTSQVYRYRYQVRYVPVCIMHYRQNRQ